VGDLSCAQMHKGYDMLHRLLQQNHQSLVRRVILILMKYLLIVKFYHLENANAEANDDTIFCFLERLFYSLKNLQIFDQAQGLEIPLQR